MRRTGAKRTQRWGAGIRCVIEFSARQVGNPGDHAGGLDYGQHRSAEVE